MKLIVYPGNPLQGKVSLPGDKSLSHRAALFAALAQGESRIENFLVSGVTDAMLRSLVALGVPLALEGTTLQVTGRGLHGLHPSATPLDCGNSATTMRLLAGALAACGIPAVLDGSPGLRRRPMERIVEPLRLMGVPIETGTNGGAPLHLAARPPETPLRAVDYTMPVASAQVKTCLLLAALAADGPTTLHEPALSRDHSERMLRGMGVPVETRITADGASAAGGATITLTPPSPCVLAPLDMTIPADMSAAAFLIVAALVVPDSEITLCGVGLNPTRTGLLEALQEMGADIGISNRTVRGGEAAGDITVRHSSLRGVSIRGERVVAMIDEFPAFAIAATCAQGLTEVRDAQELRHKESDRITALCTELNRLGVTAQENPDGFTIPGGSGINGGTVDPHGDHRLAMALAVAGLIAQDPVGIMDAEIIAESFPEFTVALQQLGARLDEEV